MKFVRTLLFLLIGTACTSPEPPAPVPGPPPAPTPPTNTAGPLAKYTVLLGDWMDSTSSPELRVHEQWRTADDSTLNGHGYVLSGKDTVFVEDLKLTQEDGQVVYSARIDSQNNGEWIPFAALPAGPDSLVFENPGHDFPQCIMYVRDTTGRWNVRVNGVEKGLPREETFVLTRRGA